MSKELLEKIGVGLLAGLMGLIGGVARDRLSVENREASGATEIRAINQRLDNVQTDVREIRQILIDQRPNR